MRWWDQSAPMRARLSVEFCFELLHSQAQSPGRADGEDSKLGYCQASGTEDGLVDFQAHATLGSRSCTRGCIGHTPGLLAGSSQALVPPRPSHCHGKRSLEVFKTLHVVTIIVRSPGGPRERARRVSDVRVIYLIIHPLALTTSPLPHSEACIHINSLHPALGVTHRCSSCLPLPHYFRI